MNVDVDRVHGRRADARWERVSVGDIFERMTWSRPNAVAILAAPCAVRDPAFARVTWLEAEQWTNRMANALLAKGLARGSRVALFCDNSVEAFLLKFGIAKAGMVAVPFNTMMASDMVAHSLQLTQASAAFMDAEHDARFASSLHEANVQVLATIQTVDGDHAGYPSLHRFLDAAPATEPDVTIHGDDIWQILMTSGTTSMPKAVMISHTYSHLAALNQAYAFSHGTGDPSEFRFCTFFPLIYHVGDQVFSLSALIVGGSLLLGRIPQPERMLRSIDEHRPSTLFGGSPQFMADLALAGERERDHFSLASLKVIVFSWGSLAPELAERLTTLCDGVRLMGIFGQTECIALHRFPVDRHDETFRAHAPRSNLVGLPSPLLASDVVDAQGQSLIGKPGIAGEVVYRSPIVTAGYFRDEAATRAAFRGGWFHSGDLCEVLEDGTRVMVDREKDVVKSGGENVSSLRVEAACAAHPAVSRVAVVGLPDPRWGEAVTAVVVRRNGETLDADALIAFCRSRLAGYETPKRVVFVDELPVTVGGKVLKYKLRKQLADAQQA